MTHTFDYELNKITKLTTVNIKVKEAYLKPVRDIEFRRGYSHQVVQQHHDQDGQKDGKVTDSGAHLHKMDT